MAFENVLQAIGNTPIVRLNRVTEGLQAHVYGKVEAMNPGGSIKDRIGWYMIEDAERRGAIQPGGTIVECTSGNTGMGLAIAAAIKGYKCVFTLPDKMSSEKIRNLRAFGARVIVTPTAVEPEDPRSYYSVAKRIAAETPNSVWLNQYDNLSNREVHYKTTGPEILRQMPEIDVLVAGVGTGGTLSGCGKYLKEHKPGVQIVGVDPVGSIVYDYFKTGKMETRPKTYKIEGIGEDFIPKNYDFETWDDMVQVEDKEAHLMTRDLLTKEGLFVGVSCGAATVGALRWIKAQGDKLKGKNVLVILPDSGNRYLSKVFDDDWMREAGFLEEDSMGTVGDLLHAVKPKGETLIMVRQNDKISTVTELLRSKGISQVPVQDDQGWIKGLASEGRILQTLSTGQAKPTDPIGQIAAPTIEFVQVTDPIETASRLLAAGKTPLVTHPTRSGEILGIITKIDLITFLGARG